MNDSNLFLPEDAAETKAMLMVAMLKLAGVAIETMPNKENLLKLEEQLNSDVKRLRSMLNVPPSQTKDPQLDSFR